MFLSVSDLSQYVIWVRGPQRSPLDWAVQYVCCWVGRMSLAHFQENWWTRSSAKWGYGTTSMLVVRSITGYIVAYEIEVSNGNSNTQSTILKNWVRGLYCVSSSFLVIIISYLNSFSTGSEIISQKVFACLSRQYSLLLNAKAPKTCMASLYLACVASVSNRVIARKLERKRHSFFFALVPAF